MIPTPSEADMKKTATLTGWLYFLIIFSSLLSLWLLGGKFTVMGDSRATVLKMAENARLVRITAVYELFMFSAVIALAVGLHEMLKQVDRLLARTAMLLRVGEAILGYLTVVCTLAVLLIIKGQIHHEPSVQWAILFYDLRDIAYQILMICISLGTMLFCWLFYKSRYIPRTMALWGITGFFTMLSASVLKGLAIEAGNLVNAIAAGMVIPFELVIGLWLMIKGVNLNYQK